MGNQEVFFYVSKLDKIALVLPPSIFVSARSISHLQLYNLKCDFTNSLFVFLPLSSHSSVYFFTIFRCLTECLLIEILVYLRVKSCFLLELEFPGLLPVWLSPAFPHPPPAMDP